MFSMQMRWSSCLFYIYTQRRMYICTYNESTLNLYIIISSLKDLYYNQICEKNLFVIYSLAVNHKLRYDSWTCTVTVERVWKIKLSLYYTWINKDKTNNNWQIFLHVIFIWNISAIPNLKISVYPDQKTVLFIC